MAENQKELVPIVILAAGEARRLRPLSNQTIKPIIPILGVPLIERIINNYYFNGFVQFFIVIGEAEIEVKKTVKQMDIFKNKIINVDFILQKKAIGMADAIYQVKEKILGFFEVNGQYSEDSIFIVTAADVFFELDTPNRLLENHRSNDAHITLSILYSEDDEMSIGHGNVAMSQIDGISVTEIIEKPGPENKISNFYSMPIYVFSADIFMNLSDMKKSVRGELEIQDIIQQLIKERKKVIGIDILPSFKREFLFNDIGAFHITFIRDVLSMNTRFIDKFSDEKKNVEEKDRLEIIGDHFFIEKESKIGENCTIMNSYIFSGSEIGENSHIEKCVVGKGVKLPKKVKFVDKLILKEGIFDINS